MKTTKAVTGILTLFVHIPIWYYLVYHILVSIHASELMWFLFWVYMPVGILVNVLQKIIEAEGLIWNRSSLPSSQSSWRKISRSTCRSRSTATTATTATSLRADR